MDNPAHKVYNVYLCFILFCYNNRKGIESRVIKKSQFDLYNENYYILQENFFKHLPRDFYFQWNKVPGSWKKNRYTDCLNI